MTSLNQRITNLENNTGTGTGTGTVTIASIENLQSTLDAKQNTIDSTAALNAYSLNASYNIDVGGKITSTNIEVLNLLKVSSILNYGSFTGNNITSNGTMSAVSMEATTITGTDLIYGSNLNVATKIESIENDLLNKQNIITDDSLTISNTQNLQSSLDSKQNIITDNSLTISNVENLQSSLDYKQDILLDGGLSISKTLNLQSTLDSKQDVIIDNSLTISNTQNLQSSLDAKQDAILDDNLTISKTLNLQSSLDSKQDQLIAGDNIIIVDNIISSSGGATIDSTTDLTCNTLTTLSDVSINGVVTLSNQPRFKAYRTENIIFIGSTIMIYSDIVYNIGGGTYNTTTGEYTIPVDGLYLFTVTYSSVQYYTNEVNLRKNEIIMARAQLGTSLRNSVQNITVVMDCLAGDIIDVHLVNGRARIPMASTVIAPEGLTPFWGIKLN